MVVSLDREPDVFGAISHPARRLMLVLLVEADRSVNTIAGHSQMSRPAVSQHLRILLAAGLVTEPRHGRERRYRLVPARIGSVRCGTGSRTTSGSGMTPSSGFRSIRRKGSKND
jgi:DNA-binding transcriptional ArsR family regulator